MRRRTFARLAALMLAASLMPFGASAQTASGPITIIVPFTPGGGTDILARALSERMQQQLGRPVVLEHKPGASGSIGMQIVARSAPDGATIMLVSNPFTSNVSLLKNVPYDPETSFAPIAQVGAGALALAVHPSVPVTSTAEFIAYAKARPGQVNYSSPGKGTPHHLAMELFNLTTQTKMQHVPYRGTAGAMQDLIGGHVNAAFMAMHIALPLVEGKQVRLLAAAGRARMPVAPDLPTLHELGLDGFDVTLWYGMLAPAGTPSEIVERYGAIVNDALKDPRMQETLAKQGLVATGGSPEQFRQFIARDVAKWKNVVKEAGISTD